MTGDDKMSYEEEITTESEVLVEEAVTGEPEKEDSLLKSTISMIIYAATMILVVIFIVTFVGQKVEVSGISMENTLHDKEQLFLEKVSYRFGDPKRFDIIVFRPYEDEKNIYYIKRLIGLPGETIQIMDSNIYINGEILEESYGRESMIDSGIAETPIVLGEDEFFVLGDNRNRSKDSRSDEVGIVHRNQITGRAFIRVWPLNKISILKHQ